MDASQKAVYDELSQSRKTGTSGPSGPWLASAPLADAAQNLGRVCRYETSFTQRETELAILATAYANRAAADWTLHVEEARKAGLEEEYIGALARGHVPAFEPGSKEAAIYAVSADLLLHRRVSADHYAEGVSVLGEKAMVELVSIVGYYTYCAMTTNAFEIEPKDLPSGAHPKAPWEADAI